ITISFRILYLPPYSPHLSPIEMCRSEVSEKSRSRDKRSSE
ncbi:MAG TPA: IS630 family transposase, partial [Desulfobacteraceae bacterium]|nr:IS630 family transposase [Desulfobacteraceae bacterium]